jgi:hypothetical protein
MRKHKDAIAPEVHTAWEPVKTELDRLAKYYNVQVAVTDGFSSHQRRVGTRRAGCGRVDNGGRTASNHTPAAAGGQCDILAWAPFCYL